MNIAGRYRISADRQTVWNGLNDPEVLQAAIPGCEELVQEEENKFSAVVVAKFGPVKAKFNGAVSLENRNPPESYKLVGEGKGGVAGYGKGSANVTLEEEAPGVTILTYTSNAKIGGKLAQIGSRLIRGTVKKMASDFFTKFAEALNAEAEELPIEETEGGEATA